MKFKVQMKDPDTLDDAIAEAVRESIKGLPGLSDDERQVLEDQRVVETGNLCTKWFEYGEYLTVEIDTEAGTCVVLPATE